MEKRRNVHGLWGLQIFSAALCDIVGGGIWHLIMGIVLRGAEKKMYAADTTACERYEQSTGETLPPESEFYITVQVYPKATE